MCSMHHGHGDADYLDIFSIYMQISMFRLCGFYYYILIYFLGNRECWQQTGERGVQIQVHFRQIQN